MSHHDEHDEHDAQCNQGDQGCGPEQSAGPNTQFLDFEIHKVMYDEAESIVREAYRELLKDAAKRRLEQCWGDRITALAHLAVDEAMADADANFEIQALIQARNDAQRSLEDRVQSILGQRSDDAEPSEPPSEPDADDSPEGGA